MTPRDSQRVVRATQIGFLVLLLACSAQLTYWMADEHRYTESVRDLRRAAYEEQAHSSAALLSAGVHGRASQHRSRSSSSAPTASPVCRRRCSPSSTPIASIG